jgi:4-alpha-glucanotransferase
METSHPLADFTKARQQKYRLFQEAFTTWRNSDGHHSREFRDFCEQQAFWLNDFAHFCALSDQQGTARWYEWPEKLRQREPKALNDSADRLAPQILYHKFLQFIAHKHWARLQTTCRQEGVRIMGDLPIYPALASCDVWVQPQQFHLDPDSLQPTHVAGVPPDFYNENGQKWGNPLYDWEAMADNDFKWWRQRFIHQLQHCDATRLDHFIGFYHYWSVPSEDKNAKNGQWVPAKGGELLQRLQDDLPHLSIVAEDLGDIIPEVTALREEFGLPGMKVLHFGFGPMGDAAHKLHAFNHDDVAYPGTHDNNTTRGWFEDLAVNEPDVALEVCRYFQSSPDSITESVIQHLYSSVANLIILPMQDILDLDATARFNTPGTNDHNWQWRLNNQNLTPAAQKLLHWGRLYERVPTKKPAKSSTGKPTSRSTAARAPNSLIYE